MRRTGSVRATIPRRLKNHPDFLKTNGSTVEPAALLSFHRSDICTNHCKTYRTGCMTSGFVARFRPTQITLLNQSVANRLLCEKTSNELFQLARTMHEGELVKSEGRLTLTHLPIHAGKGTAMLVLTRKADEQILIGNDIKITLVRVRGNSVRIGIDAPKEIRVVRGELACKDAADTPEPPVEREEVFARPEAQEKHTASINRLCAASSASSISLPSRKKPESSNQVDHANAEKSPKSFVKPATSSNTLEDVQRAPLSAFVSAT